MSKSCGFFRPEEVEYAEIAPVYQEAFKQWPWFEVSKCADERPAKRCPGGLSRLAIGSACQICDRSPTRPAYEADELTERFDQLAATRPTAWYLEREKQVALAAVAWTARPQTVWAEKYRDVPEMENWMNEVLGSDPVVWLDEVFADKSLCRSGNLTNFQYMCDGFTKRLGGQVLAFRTKTPAMTRAAARDFEGRVSILQRRTEVPDERDFVVIRSGGEL